MAEQKSKYQPPKRVDKAHKAEMLEIGMKLVKLRNNTGLSVSAYSDKLEISRNSYSKMEKGEIYFSLENLLKIINHHGLDLMKFLQTDIENL